MAYENTKVPAAQSQADLRRLLRLAGAVEIGTSSNDRPNYGRHVSIQFELKGYRYRISAALTKPDVTSAERRANRSGSPVGMMLERMLDQDEQRVWRVIYYLVKNRLEAVQEGIETIEQSLFAYMVVPETGQTMWEAARPALNDGRLLIASTRPALPARTEQANRRPEVSS